MSLNGKLRGMIAMVGFLLISTPAAGYDLSVGSVGLDRFLAGESDFGSILMGHRIHHYRVPYSRGEYGRHGPWDDHYDAFPVYDRPLRRFSDRGHYTSRPVGPYQFKRHQSKHGGTYRYQYPHGRDQYKHPGDHRGFRRHQSKHGGGTHYRHPSGHLQRSPHGRFRRHYRSR